MIILLFLLSVSIASSEYFISNPASLQLSNKTTRSLRYLKIRTDIANNSLSFFKYNQHFNTDPNWDSIQKTTILNAIPDIGFKINVDASVTLIEFNSKLFSVSLLYRHLGSGGIPKDLFDLTLFGNDLNRQYNLSEVEINSIGYFDGSIGLCYPVIKMTENSNASNIWSLKQLNVGGRFHYQRGIIVTQTDSSDGYVSTTPAIFLAKAKLFQSVAKGASCFAFDLGTTAELQNRLTVGALILNINTGFKWTQKPEQMLLEVSIDSFSVQRYLDFNNIDSFFNKADTTYPIPSFKTSIPAQLLLQASYQPINLITISTYYHHYLTQSRFIDNFTRNLGIDFYLSPVRFFATGISFMTNLKKDFKIGHSFHFFIKGFNFNIFANQRNGYLVNAKGLDFGLSFAQNW